MHIALRTLSPHILSSFYSIFLLLVCCWLISHGAIENHLEIYLQFDDFSSFHVHLFLLVAIVATKK
nr:MAG TPA: hypothetical protein [Caudoviricetes sp.]